MTNQDPTLSMLVVDDEKSIQLILRHYFKDHYSVTMTNNGKEALLWMEKGNIPDIIIADINMPEMDGYKFIERKGSDAFLKNIPLIMLSGCDNSDSRIRCIEMGADDFLTKPFNLRELAARINCIMRRVYENNDKNFVYEDRKVKAA